MRANSIEHGQEIIAIGIGVVTTQIALALRILDIATFPADEHKPFCKLQIRIREFLKLLFCQREISSTWAPWVKYIQLI